MTNNIVTQKPDSKSIQLKGFLKQIRFASDDGTFAVCEFDAPSANVPSPMIIVGNILATKPGEHVELSGHWQNDARYGRQFAIQSIKPCPPTTRQGIERYLSSQLIDGIGPVLAKRIVAHFGEQTIDILDANPARIKEVSGIGKKRAQSIIDTWTEQRLTRQTIVFLRSYGVSEHHAAKILDTYGSSAIDLIKQNPYQLVEDIHGIGFRTADSIARHSGLDKDSPIRLQAGLVYCLNRAQQDGHLYLPISYLLQTARQLLDTPEPLLQEAIQNLVYDQKVFIEPAASPDDEAAVYPRGAYYLEHQVTRHLTRILSAPHSWHVPNIEEDIADFVALEGIELAPAQHAAILTTFRHKSTVITGGPGTGKTTIIQAICYVAQKLKLDLKLAAPTGRAARRLSEASGREASTVHRLLEYSLQNRGFLYREDNPLNVDLLIIDEASMLDIFLLHAIVRALPDTASILLVGDVDQLPSVGPGNVLHDIIASQTFGCVRLTEVFRQAQESAIVSNAHRINHGQMPVASTTGDRTELTDFYTINASSPSVAQQRIVELITERIPQAFGLNPLDDIQILSPMHKGDVGCSTLNTLLQAHFQPDDQPAVVRGQQRWTIGDKVMQTRNNYELDVFNGDIGRIIAIHDDTKRVDIRFDDRHVSYPFKSLDELTLAYAITVHKSQGSEYPAVIIPLVTQHYVMLQKNLLYTALTRARKLAIIVGTEEAMRLCLKNNHAQKRYTKLTHRLREAIHDN